MLKDKLGNESRNDSDLRQFLANWYYICVESVKTCILTFLPVMKFLLHSVLVGKSFVIICDKAKYFEIVSFLETLSLTKSVDIRDSRTPTENSASTTQTGESEHFSDTVVLNLTNISGPLINTTEYEFSLTKETNDFCCEWANELKEMVAKSDAFKIRAFLEQKKNLILQELNYIKRLVGEAQLDHYALYKAFLYLKRNNNKDVLLVALLKENAKNKDAREVLEVIYNSLDE
jgi:hypothetical protein